MSMSATKATTQEQLSPPTTYYLAGHHKNTKARMITSGLEWEPKYDTAEAFMKDAYENDFVHVKSTGGLKSYFECEDTLIEKSKVLA